jgi:hypothetical protein
MRPRFRTALLSALVAGLFPAASALATVSLNFNGVSSVSVVKGNTFSLRVNLVATSEQTTGLDYYLRALSLDNKFIITDRNISTSPYNEVNQSDAAVETLPDSILSLKGDGIIRNEWDLGATVTDVFVPQSAGTKLVSLYTILVDPTTANGSYTLETYSQPGTGWVGTSPSFTESPFNTHASMQVIVTPEPAAIGVLGLAAVGLVRRRR